MLFFLTSIGNSNKLGVFFNYETRKAKELLMLPPYEGLRI